MTTLIPSRFAYKCDVDYSDDVRDTAIHTVTVFENSGRLIGTASIHRRLADGETLASITPELERRALYKLRHRIARGYSVDTDNHQNDDVVAWIASNYDECLRIARTAIESARIQSASVPLDGRASDWHKTLDELAETGLQHLIEQLLDHAQDAYTHQHGKPLPVEQSARQFIGARSRHRFIAYGYYAKQSDEYGYGGTDVDLDTPVEWSTIDAIEFSELLDELTDELTTEQRGMLEQLIAGESMRTVASGADTNAMAVSRLVSRVREKYCTIDGATMPRTLSRCAGEITPTTSDYDVYIK